jgi:L-rhamnonate dehydratase
MKRRSFFTLGGLCAVSLPALAFQEEKSKLKITGVRIVQTRPKRPVPSYTPAPGSWSTSGVEVANPMSIYPEYKPQRSLWNPDPGKFGTFTVEVSTDKGVKGYGSGGAGGAEVINSISSSS